MLYYLKKNKNKTLDYSGKMTLFKVLYFQEKKFFSGNEYKSKGERGYGSGGEKNQTGLRLLINIQCHEIIKD